MVPVYIIEEHHEAYYIWNKAILEEKIEKENNTLIHIDHHDDMEGGGYDFSFCDLDYSMEQIHKITYEKLGIADFILPALYQRIFNEVVIIKSFMPILGEEIQRFVKLKDDNSLIMGNTVPFLHGKYKNDSKNEVYRFFSYREGGLSTYQPANPSILDIDLDYFSWDDSLSTSDDKLIEITKEAYEDYMDNPYHPFRILPKRLLKAITINNKYYLTYCEYGKSTPPSTEEKITKRIDKFAAWIQENHIQPQLIDICRSRYSGYTPNSVWKLIEDKLVKKLNEIYDCKIISNDSVPS